MERPPSPTTALPDESDRLRYYAAALRALAFIEQRAPTTRRFGAEADARWGALRGNLTTADRLDLLLRDADAHWPSSFGARAVFALRAAAEDEAFGAAWAPLDPVDAEELWRSVLAEPAPTTVAAALQAAAASWGLAIAPFDAGSVVPTDRLVLVGPSAVAAAALLFASGRDLDWVDQAVCVATPPAHRQVAALVAPLLHAGRPTPLAAAGGPLPAGVAPVPRRLIASPDAAPDDLAHASRLAGGGPLEPSAAAGPTPRGD